MKKLSIQDQSLLELKQIEKLNEQKKEMVINLINALAQKKYDDLHQLTCERESSSK